LLEATARGHGHVVKELLNQNADIESKNNFGATSLINDMFLNQIIHFYALETENKVYRLYKYHQKSRI
jgi:hypothetical protein